MDKNFSIIIPVYNEAENIENLINEINFHIKEKKYIFEIIIIDDNSNDNTSNILDIIKKNNNNKVSILKNKKNMGQSYSIRKGIENSTNNTVVTIDGDGQNNPKDITKLIEIYFSNKEIKLLGGIRKKRKDTIIKIIASKIANYIRNVILKDDCPDTGCSLKVFNKEIFLSFPFFTGLHRFLPALFKSYGYKTYFIPVDHRKRTGGISSYGIFDRLIRGIIDIIKVLKIIRSIKK